MCTSVAVHGEVFKLGDRKEKKYMIKEKRRKGARALRGFDLGAVALHSGPWALKKKG